MPCSGIAHTEYHRKRIYRQPPHHTADNHFSGENVYAEVGRRGGACTHTYRRDRFPKGLKKHFHHDKVPPGCPKAKAMRYENPICAVQKVEASGDAKAYTKTIVSFQSTGATNIAGVNNLQSGGGPEKG